MNYLHFVLIFVLLLSMEWVEEADAHGLMLSPSPWNLHAYQGGLLGSRYEATALNNNIYQTSFRSDSVCGQIQNGGPNGMNYDKYSSGIQATYSPGEVIIVTVEITVYHFGHFEFSLCPAGTSGTPSQDCFRENKLNIVKDIVHNAPIDPNYPKRAMIPPESFGKSYSYEVLLPSDISEGNYVLKWMYVSGNSCVAEGYNKYPFPSSWGPMYTQGLAICGVYDKATPLAAPEIFINCAEVAIKDGRVSPVSSPVRPNTVDTPTAQRVPSPTRPPPTRPSPTRTRPSRTSPTRAPLARNSPTTNKVPTPGNNPASPTTSGKACCANGASGLKASNNCEGYVHCVNGVDYGFVKCGAGLKFQQNGSYCDYADKVQCLMSCSRSA